MLTASRILNFDEAGINHNATGSCVVATRGARAVHRQTDSSRVRHSFVSCISAAGAAAPAFIIQPGSRKAANMDTTLDGCPDGWTCTVSKNGYMTTKTMLEFIAHLEKWTALTERAPNEWSLFVVDGYHSHTVCDEVLQRFRDLRIHMISLPSHTTAELQPCDVGVFRALKASVAAEMDKYRSTSGHPHVPQDEFARILARAWPAGHAKESILNAFRFVAHVYVL